MAEISEAGGSLQSTALNIKDDDCLTISSQRLEFIHFMQKLIAEFMGTYLMLFAGFAAGVVNRDKEDALTFPGVAILWGLDVMVMIYTVGHISGAHFNPAVTIAFAACKRFAWKHVPAYITVQLLASTLASATLVLIFDREKGHVVGTFPIGSNKQSLEVEFIITFYLMFAVRGVATDDRAVISFTSAPFHYKGELAGLTLGATVTINTLFAGPISGASMNPARSLGPAMVFNQYKGIWIYIVGPITRAIAGAWFYDVIRLTDKPCHGIIRNKSFQGSSANVTSSDQ
ncbi:unnamed protein product [Fraxinus pennsylvanica]|uniref:Uncharacterized protein n=1 Tax=Fraxinus pennsylvanica TaxID=56036 RepID=A0AAD2E9G9_9LAMI|nr:unnamed protein product [Fraxinus pennsylvanica]